LLPPHRSLRSLPRPRIHNQRLRRGASDSGTVIPSTLGPGQAEQTTTRAPASDRASRSVRRWRLGGGPLPHVAGRGQTGRYNRHATCCHRRTPAMIDHVGVVQFVPDASGICGDQGGQSVRTAAQQVNEPLIVAQVRQPPWQCGSPVAMIIRYKSGTTDDDKRWRTPRDVGSSAAGQPAGTPGSWRSSAAHGVWGSNPLSSTLNRVDQGKRTI
jgi:hypothetical protein